MRGPALPIDDLAGEITSAAAAAPSRVVVQAPTGSGKSTRLPQILLDHGAVRGRVVVLQPRRVAARMLARRVAWERGCRVGGEVGYQVRFEKAVGEATRIIYVTEGVLLRWMQDNPQLDGIGAVVFDEFHERHLDGDTGLAFARRLQEKSRPDLGLFMVSATLDGMNWEAWLPQAGAVFSEGRTYPVDIRYLARDPRPGEPVWETAVRGLETLVVDDPEADALVFMPGVHEIRKTLELLGRQRWARGRDLLPLFGELPPEKQDLALTGGGRPRVIVATNVAETSLTIDGVRLVVDSGLARISGHDPSRGLDTLTVQPVSRASADQRAGRAGRTAAGTCLRLWSEASHGRRPRHTLPEIHRVDPSGVMLELQALGVDDLDSFPWVEPPLPEAMARAWDLLAALGAVDADRAITRTGRELARLPVHPRLARFLVEARNRECAPLAAVVAGLVEGRGILLGGNARGRAQAAENFAERHDFSDFQPLVRALAAAEEAGMEDVALSRLGISRRAVAEVRQLASQFARLVVGGRGFTGRIPAEGPAWDGLAVALAAAYADHVAVQVSQGTRTCEVAGGRRGKISPESRVAAKARLLVASELAEVEGKKLEVVLRGITRIEEQTLIEVDAQGLHDREEVIYDPGSKRVVTRRARCWRDLVLEEKRVHDAPREQAGEILAAEVVAGRLPLPGWDTRADQWVERVNFLAERVPEAGLAPFGADEKALVLQHVCEGAAGAKDLKTRKVEPVLRQWLDAGQRAALDAMAPEHVVLENGRKTRVHYEAGKDPEIRLTVQHLYDIRRHPTVAGGQVPLAVVVLAPNQRPQQTTTDIAGFWERGYPELKKQLKGRYPKHEWR